MNMVTKPIRGKGAEALKFLQSVGIQDSATWSVSSSLGEGMAGEIHVLGYVFLVDKPYV